MSNPEKIVARMYDKDAFSQWLGIQCVVTGEGFCTLAMLVREDMTNGFGIAHGGITYALADSALAFASNSHGRHAVSVETSISHTKKVKTGDVLTATAKKDHLSNKIGVYSVEICNQKGEIVALFKGTVYRTEVEWDV